MLTAPANVKNLKMMIIYVFNMFHKPPRMRQSFLLLFTRPEPHKMIKVGNLCLCNLE